MRTLPLAILTFFVLLTWGCGEPAPEPPTESASPPDASVADDAGPDACTPRTCHALGVSCGVVDDGCGKPLACGACDAGCVPETDAALCSTAHATCGALTVVDRCGRSRKITTCGACPPGMRCGEGGHANACACAPETDAALCARLGASCGGLTATDNCGASRTVSSCGSCSGATTCGGGGQSNACGCAPEDDAALCAAAGRNCGALTKTDRCGASRTVASCGQCAASETCGGGGSAGVCGAPSCVPETDRAFCTRFGKTCGAFAGTDNCAQPRSVASCGACAGRQTCGGGGTAGTCGCTGEPDATLCSQRGQTCGSLTTTDKCLITRVIASCGSCASPETCGGGGVANACGCTNETDAAFCARLGKTCGAVTDTDKCGHARTVASCGACASPLTCGGGGTANACGCAAETTAQLCAKYGTTCGPFSAVDGCGVSRTLDCGACSAGQSCGANGLVGQCSAVASFSAGQTGGHPVSIAPAFLDRNIEAIHAVSPSEVWVASFKNLVRVRPGSAEPYFIDGLVTTYGAVRFWSSGPSDVWFSSGTLLFHFDGAHWSAVSAGFAAGSSIRAIHGTASNDVWVAAALSGVPEIRHFDGANWSAWTVPTGSDVVDDLGGQSHGAPYVARGSDVFRWNGLSYVALPSRNAAWGPSRNHRIWVSPAGTLFASSIGCDGGFYSNATVERFNGTTWSTLYQNSISHVGCSYFEEPNLGGSADDDVWFGDPWGGGHRFTSSVASMSGFMVAPTGTSAGFTADDRRLYALLGGKSVPRFDAGVAPKCTQAFADGAGGAWLLCNGQLGRADGAAFSQRPASSKITAIFASPSTSLWLALDTGALERRNAAGTTLYTDYLGSTFAGISGTSDSNLWAVTASGGALHFDGTHWTTSAIPVGTNGTITGIEASSTTAWAWSPTALFTWSGSAWTPAAMPTPSVRLQSVRVYDDTPWLMTWQSGLAQPYVLYSKSGATWKAQRGASNGLLLGMGAAGIVTLSTNAARAGTLEAWQDSGATTLATFTDVESPSGACLVMPTGHSALYCNYDSVYLAPF
jgi:hypothetical protein